MTIDAVSKGLRVLMGAFHYAKISGKFGWKFNGTVRTKRKITGPSEPPLEVVHLDRLDRRDWNLPFHSRFQYRSSVSGSLNSPTWPPRLVIMISVLFATIKLQICQFCSCIHVRRFLVRNCFCDFKGESLTIANDIFPRYFSVFVCRSWTFWMLPNASKWWKRNALCFRSGFLLDHSPAQYRYEAGDSDSSHIMSTTIMSSMMVWETQWENGQDRTSIPFGWSLRSENLFPLFSSRPKWSLTVRSHIMESIRWL